MVLLDTCALVELCRLNSRLSEVSLHRLQKQECAILSVSFAEVALKQKRGKIPTSPKMNEVHNLFLQLENIKIIDMGVQEWLDAIELDWSHKDPVDRVIVAYAKKLDIPIVTTDKEIKKFYKNIIW